MRYGLFFCLFLGLVFSLGMVSGLLDLEIEKIDKGAVVVSELGDPAVYEFIITNRGEPDFVEIYSLVGVSFSPVGFFELPKGITTMEIKAYPGKAIREKEGDYSIGFEIKGNQGIFKDVLPIQVVSLEDIFTISSGNVLPDDDFGEVIVTNRINSYLEGINIDFNSIFFDFNEEFDIEPYGTVNLSGKIDKTKITKLIAGPYVTKSEIEAGDKSFDLEGIINYLEKEGVSVERDSSGFLIRKSEVRKTNQGNVPTTVEIEMSKNIISRLFTTYSIEPLSSDRSGGFVNYVWKDTIGPGEDFMVVARTNYTLPFIVVVLIALTIFLVNFYSSSAISVRKRVSLVKTKGGEFALKVKISVKARKNVENIEIVDRLPGMTKLFEKYGGPDRVDEKTRQLFWNVSRINSGEERTFSYIIYSKVRAVGRFELPSAQVVFEKDGEKDSVTSNRAYFVSETASD